MTKDKKAISKQKMGSKELGDKDFQGEPYDDSYDDGPTQDRECRDIICCLLFIAFLVGMVLCAQYGYNNGDITMLLSSYNSKGNACQGDHHLLYLPSLFSGDSIWENSCCVSNCPKDTESVNKDTNGGCIDRNIATYTTGDYFKRYCLPVYEKSDTGNETEEDYADREDKVIKKLAEKKAQQYMNDIAYAYPLFFYSALIALFLGLVYMVFLRFCAGVITWCSIIIFTVLLAVLGYYFWDLYQNPEEGSTKDTDYQYMAIFCWVILAIWILFLICMFNAIRLAVAIIKTSAIFVVNTLHIMFLPPILILVSLAYIAWWTYTAVAIYSVGDIKGNGEAYPQVEWSSDTRYVWYYHLFGLFWVLCFFVAIGLFVISATSAQWYFSHPEPSGSVSKSVYWTFRYHLGSISFGSLLLAIIMFVRAIFEYIRWQLMKSPAVAANCCIACLLKIVSCCLWCCNNLIKFLTKNAYIQMAITGEGFCQSAKLAYYLIVRNTRRFAATEAIGSIFMFIGKVAIAIFSAWICWFILNSDNYDYKKNIFSPIMPTVVCFCIAYIIAAMFLAVYGQAASTILQCFLVDEEIADSKGETGGKHTPELLKPFISKITKSKLASDLQKK